MKFYASLWTMKTDHEGETKLTLCVPLSNLPDILTLPAMNQKLLKVNIEVSEETEVNSGSVN